MLHADRRSIRYIHGFRCFYSERVVRLFDFLPTTAKRTLCGLRLVGSLSRVYPMPREMFANVHRRSLTLKDTVRGDCVIFVMGETSFKRISLPMNRNERELFN